MNHPSAAAIVLAGGSSRRMASDIPKQYRILCGKTVLAHSLRACAEAGIFSFYVIVSHPDHLSLSEDICRAELPPGSFCVTAGGASRTDSARAGFSALKGEYSFVAIHDAARCAVLPEDIRRIYEAAVSRGAAIAARTVTDTVKTIVDGRITGTLDRSRLLSVQTPQIFSYEVYQKALGMAEKEGGVYTDDHAMVARCGVEAVAVLCGVNPKITFEEDFPFVEYLLEKRKEKRMRIGHGYDVHRLTEGRPLVIGGVRIPFSKGLLGHSDADVLLHAIMDALLGAAGLPDIGRLFPDSDQRYEGADSLVLLADVVRLIGEKGFRVVNIDATVIAQAPKLSPYVSSIKQKIAATVGCSENVVGVKATTEEGLGFTGSEEGIAAHAVCLLE